MVTTRDWRSNSPVDLVCEKRPASGAGGMAVTNHPLGTAAAVEMLAAGGNAIDAAVAALLALTVVEPMMVGIAGGGLSHVRLADGRNVVFDALAAAPAATHGETFEPVSDEPPNHMASVGERSARGPASVAVPGNLLGWEAMHARFGRLPFADLVAPATRLAARGFTVTHYLAGAIAENVTQLAADPAMAAVFVPDGTPLAPGARLVQPGYAESLRLIEREGAAALHGGALGDALASRIRAGREDDGFLTADDLAAYRVVEREAIHASYRGFDIAGPPPPASSGVHVTEMLNIVEGLDVAGLGYGTVEGLDVIARVLAIAFADRRLSSGDPAFVDVPVDRLTSKSYAQERRRDLPRAVRGQPLAAESADTTHITIADRDGNVVCATHTINGIFGANIMVPEAGFIPNNYMMNFDPHPGRALSVAPGKRVPTSMAPMIATEGGRLAFALGLPGGLRIFPCAFQAILNLVDHGMTLQEAVEAPRLWTEGHVVEIEEGYAHAAEDLRARGHDVKIVPHVGGGMNAIAFEPDGTMTGAACWRADGTVAALGGGLARPGVRFWPGQSPDEADDADDIAEAHPS